MLQHKLTYESNFSQRKQTLANINKPSWEITFASIGIQTKEKTMKTGQIIMMLALAGSMILTLGTQKAGAETLLEDLFPQYDIPLEISANLDFYDKYIWRGFRLDGDWVVQPAVTLSAYGFEGGFWGSFQLENEDPLAGDEVDGWIGYSTDLGFINEDLQIFSVSLGNTWYSFPRASTGLSDGAHAQEFYIGGAIDTLLSPNVTWYYDYSDEESGGADGSYLVFNGSHSFTVNETYGITLDISQDIGLNNEAFIAGDGGWSNTVIGMTIPLTERVSVSPVLAYSVPWGDLEDASDGNQDDEFYGGVLMSFAM